MLIYGSVMPTIALTSRPLLPFTRTRVELERTQSVEAAKTAARRKETVFLVAQKPNTEEIREETLCRTGVVGEITEFRDNIPGKLPVIQVKLMHRATWSRIASRYPYVMMEVDPVMPDPVSDAENKALIRVLQDLLQEYINQLSAKAPELQRFLSNPGDLEEMVFGIAASLMLKNEGRQQLLDEKNLVKLVTILGGMIADETEILKIRNEFQKQVKDQLDDNQKQYILREQLKVLHKELGDTSDSEEEIDRFREAADKLNASQEVKDRLEREIRRLGTLSHGSPEGAVIRNYIENVLAMPWENATEETLDLKKAELILNRDHYGMEKVKERILDYLAVRSLSRKNNRNVNDAPILCLVGPPGTGKTSIAHSVAEALNKKYVRVSLGGVRDEAEIRGHRKTYIGAMPGRIAEAIRHAGEKNPLMLLDEIDKASSDYKGDVSSALLEVLDPEQNRAFRDHYLELPIDLSETLFLATANSLDNVPRPLLDRMEILQLSSYTETEKFQIAKKYLVKKQIERNGLNAKQFSITDGALRALIHGYTREAGVRSLERRIAELCRKSARKILQDDLSEVRIREKDLSDWLGRAPYRDEQANKKPQIGIVRGLAWTSVGGDTLEIEVNSMPGKGELELTGQLGDVMKESALTALSYVRSLQKETGAEDDYYDHHDIHLHIPEGAVPKDGPSAGVTMATALYSVVSGTKVRADVAMTGEVTLRGRVMPIGGLKEKLLAAKQAHMKTVLVPRDNRFDVEELPAEVKEGLEIILCSDMSEILEHALVLTE